MADRKKIVFVLSGYGRVRRGAERLTAELAERLADDFDVRVLGSGRDAPFAVPLPCIDRENAVTGFLNRLPGVGHFLRTFQLDPLNWEWLSHARAAKKWLKHHPCDLLVVEGGRWGGRLGRWARKALHIPFVDIAHGAFSRWEIAAARANPDCYVAATQEAERQIKAAVPDVKTEVIPPGIDLSRFTPDGPRMETGLQAPVVLSVGAMEPLKRLDRIIDVLAKTDEGGLLLIGDGPLREQIEQQGMRALGAKRFRRIAADYADMPTWYRSADVLVSLSASEAFGLVYLEAMACGLPLVVQQDDIRREVLDGEAVFVNEPDAGELASALQTALEGKDDLRAERLDYAQRFDIAKTAAAYRRLFMRLMD